MRFKTSLFLIALLFCNATFCFAQLNNAKKIIHTLSSPDFHGRGYVSKGDKIAAKFIQKEFKKLDLKKFNKSYLQEFSFSINTQPKELLLALNKEKLIPGKEYLIDPASPSIKGTFETLSTNCNELLHTDQFLNKLRNSANKILLIDCYNLASFDRKQKNKINELINFLRYSKEHPAKAVIVFNTEKLTWHGSTIQAPKASFTVSKKVNLETIKTIKLDCKSKFKEKYTSNNCIGYIEGSTEKDSIIAITAHYDHLGRMGKSTYFPGANDNASGIALLLEIANYFSQHPPKYTLVFLAFGGEEIGLLGSKYFTENPLFPLKNIKFLWNFDLAGTGSEGLKIVNGSVYEKEFEKLLAINTKENLLPGIYKRGKACNSDHCYFDQLGVKTFYSYTLGGIKAYHDIYDKPETLPLTEFLDYKKIMCRFIEQL
ncbi:M28 family metallopeptidase [Flavicella sediminum]|uniref:M28 family metallopeptidase n=1 Tax=Flavicella sediminum TaxID=2585141 RepID=UPI0011238F03|nr:M28 family peptidase [Flavicella sediminum]